MMARKKQNSREQHASVNRIHILLWDIKWHCPLLLRRRKGQNKRAILSLSNTSFSLVSAPFHIPIMTQEVRKKAGQRHFLRWWNAMQCSTRARKRLLEATIKQNKLSCPVREQEQEGSMEIVLCLFYFDSSLLFAWLVLSFYTSQAEWMRKEEKANKESAPSMYLQFVTNPVKKVRISVMTRNDFSAKAIQKKFLSRPHHDTRHTRLDHSNTKQ